MQRVATLLIGKIYDAGGATASCRDGAANEVVTGHRVANGKLQMRVDIHAAWEDVVAIRVYDLTALHIVSDNGDLACLDTYVRPVGFAGCDDGSVLDDSVHQTSILFNSRTNCPGLPGWSSSRLSSAVVTASLLAGTKKSSKDR